ncbi:MAG: Abi family protein [Clostridia bacterium]|nr:Abi family protein [Clostridia bacterium]
MKETVGFALKQPMTFDEQILHLRNNRGLLICDVDRAKKILQSVNYYRLSAYGIGLMDKAADRYHSGVTLEQIYSLYVFDSRLRNILNPVIEYIEIQLRTQIAYQLAMQYGAEGYRNPNNFNYWFNKSKQTDAYTYFCEQLDSEIQKQKRKPFVKHHIDKYGGHFPIWVAVELLSLGALSTLYKIMKDPDQKAVANFYRTKPDFVKSWFAAIVELRNTCAHYGRIYNMPLDSLPKLPRKNSEFFNRRFFTDCLAMRYITKTNSVWRTFVSNLRGIIDECEAINLSFIGFPDNWEELLSESVRA